MTLLRDFIKHAKKHDKNLELVCYKHILDEKRKKLDNKSEAIIMVRYHLTRAYKLIFLITKKITTSRDVVFNENMTWKWDENCIGRE
ncbi:hypothetical protein CR513_56138, partial [Mucuna pruriens]